MDELRGPMIQIVLRIKEGLGFGFLKNPFLVCGSLNGYLLETDVVLPSHAPIFDAELVWEADKRRFRNLRVQNVPIKLEVYTTGSHGRKNKIGYVLLSLLAAQPCPTNKLVNVKTSWFRLLGVKSEGKCCQPQLMLALTVEDRISTPTPRNHLRNFHVNEVAYLTPREGALPTLRSALQTYNEYISESKKTVSTEALKPKLLSDEGLIQIGECGKDLFVLSFVIGCADNIDLLIPEEDKNKKDTQCYVTYSIFTHNIMTDRVRISHGDSMRCSAAFNQRTSLRLCTDLSDLSKYFAECPYVITKFCYADKHVGVCSMDLRKLVPTDNIKDFSKFCNNNDCIVIHERCYLLSADEQVKSDRRKSYIDVQMSFTHVGDKDKMLRQKAMKSSHSASQLTIDVDKENYKDNLITDFKSGSCTHFDGEIGRVAYTNSTKSSNRYSNAAGDAILQNNEITEIIKKMCDTFTENQERLLTCKMRPPSVDMQVQCDGENKKIDGAFANDCKMNLSPRKVETFIISPRKNSSNVQKIEKEKIKIVLNEEDRQQLMKKYIDELEDWKEKQQDLYKRQLQMKEEYHLDALSKEWNKRRMELESKLTRGIEQCRKLSADLSQATEDFKLRGFRNSEREKKLTEAKKALEQHFSTKYQELRQASQTMEDDMNHQIRMKDMTIQELETRVASLEKQVNGLQDSLKNCEKEVERKFSGITKGHTTTMLHEMRILEEKLEHALQSKAFFKEQWSRAVRELHTNKLNQRKQLLAQLHQEPQFGDSLPTIGDVPETSRTQNNTRLLTDELNIPATASYTNLNERTDGSEYLGSSRKIAKQSTNEKLNELITQRDDLITEENLDEDKLNQLNEEIRNILLNYGT